MGILPKAVFFGELFGNEVDFAYSVLKHLHGLWFEAEAFGRHDGGRRLALLRNVVEAEVLHQVLESCKHAVLENLVSVTA